MTSAATWVAMAREGPCTGRCGPIRRRPYGAALAILDELLRRPGSVIDRPGGCVSSWPPAQREREAFAVHLLDAQHAVIKVRVMVEGTLTQTAVYPRVAERHALTLDSAAAVLAHNHPSGSPDPSRADERLTATLRQALALVEVRVLDHLVIGRLSAVSLAERGMV